MWVVCIIPSGVLVIVCGVPDCFCDYVWLVLHDVGIYDD